MRVPEVRVTGGCGVCPKCGKDIYDKYDRVCDGGTSKFVKILNFRNDNHPDYPNRAVWDIEFTCPKCGHKWKDEDASC